MTVTAVDDFYGRINQLLDTIDRAKETSLHVWASDHLTRTLVLVIANHFENEITEILMAFFGSHSGDPMIGAFCQKASERKYYQYFDWNERRNPNANMFFSLFGQDFKDRACADVKSDSSLKQGIAAFIEIGATRNDLVHKKLHEVSLTKTAPEFYELYRASLVFVDYIRKKLN